ncbi:MAG TPA: solute carrier family 23 protein [Candidatus Dormibacteraeota bacterium]|nr:solute carrier family 23 protein [Candidatus Dormibacteraeota bacterium]
MVEESTLAETTVFDIGFTERPPWWESLILAIQNIPAMTGMFLFPGLIGASFHLAPAVIAGLYGATFVTCGLVTFLQGTFLLRLPIVMGPWAATYVVIVAGGHAFGLGAAYGSFFVAALIWVLLSLPVAGGALAGWLARVFRDPIVFGGLIVIAMAYLSTISLSNWVGTPAQVGFGAANWVGGAVCIVIIFLALLFGRGLLRRGAVVLGIIGGTLAYAIFKPIPLSRLAASEWFYVPHPFQFGFSVQPLLVFFFFLMLTASASSTLSLYHLVSRWGNDDPSNTRMSAGIFSSSVGAAIAAVLGGLSTNAYPDNIGILKSTRIGSVFVTSLAGLILLLLGFVLKFDTLFIIIPSNVIAAAATVMFGIILASGIEMLRQVRWDTINSLVFGFSFLVSMGGLFVSPQTLKTYPTLVQTVISQPLLTGTFLIIVLHLLLNGGVRRLGQRAAATSVGQA